jgi:hypothetical protein
MPLPCPQNYSLSESIPVNRLVHCLIAEAAETVEFVVVVQEIVAAAAPGAPDIASNVLLTGCYTFVQLVLHHALFRTHTKKFAESAAQPGFLVVVVIPSASGRRSLPLPVVRRVARGRRCLHEPTLNPLVPRLHVQKVRAPCQQPHDLPLLRQQPDCRRLLPVTAAPASCGPHRYR